MHLALTLNWTISKNRRGVIKVNKLVCSDIYLIFLNHSVLYWADSIPSYTECNMYKERKELLSKIEDQFGANALLFVTGDRPSLETRIAGDVFDHIVNHLDKIGVVECICFIVYSRGGDTLAAWSIINLLRQYCDKLTVLIPSRAHSAATLISLGANEIVMTKQATLGPIDPSVNGPLNPQIPGEPPQSKAPVSVEAINGYLELAHEQNVNDSSEMVQMLLELSRQVHPLVLGEVYRTRSQIKMLAKKLITSQVTDEEHIEKVLQFLCSESGSHDYTINRREAKEELGLNVVKPNQQQYEVIKALYDDFSKELELTKTFNAQAFLGSDPEKNYSFRRGLIESVNLGSHVFLTEGKFSRIAAPGHPPRIDQTNSKEGWDFET